jgi:two-component sensor histidine kinase
VEKSFQKHAREKPKYFGVFSDSQSCGLRVRKTKEIRGEIKWFRATLEHYFLNKFEQVSLKQDGVRAGSSGLGLTFCKMAVEAHGGKIWVESEGLGKGCTFRILLPKYS